MSKNKTLSLQPLKFEEAVSDILKVKRSLNGRRREVGRRDRSVHYFLNRLRLIGIHVTLSPPAPDGSVWFFGKKDGVFPFARGPMCPMQEREPNDLIPAPMICKILNHLEITAEEQMQFWNIQEHVPPKTPLQPPTRC